MNKRLLVLIILAVASAITILLLAECRKEAEHTTHTMIDGECSVCNLPESSEGLEFALNPDGKSYALIGIGSCKSGEITVGAYNNLSVTVISSYAFNNSNIPTTVNVGDCVAYIGPMAFFNCNQLTTVNIGSGINVISEYAFYGCTRLRSLTFGTGSVNMPVTAFYNCPNIAYDVYEGCAYLGNSENPFLILIQADNSQICTVHENTEAIAIGAFMNCTDLVSFTVSEKSIHLKSVGGNLYSKDGKTLIAYAIGKSTASFEIPDTVECIGDGAFACSALNAVTIPDSVSHIGVSAFYRCVNLLSITLPNSVRSIGAGAFTYCTELASINLGNAVSYIPQDTFMGCSGLTSITIPGSVTEIDVYAFADCDSLSSVIFEKPYGWTVYDTDSMRTELIDSSKLEDEYSAARHLKAYTTFLWARN